MIFFSRRGKPVTRLFFTLKVLAVVSENGKEFRYGETEIVI